MNSNIKGLDQLMKKYGKLAEAVAGQSMEKAIGASVKMIQGEAKVLCPVNDGELHRSIRTMTETVGDSVIGTVYTNKKHGAYVEFGTGPRGEDSHAGISPHVDPAYTQSSWWIHESQIDKDTAEQYGWFYLDTPDGRFYQCNGQAARPFMYPALKNNEERVTRNISDYLAREIRKTVQK